VNKIKRIAALAVGAALLGLAAAAYNGNLSYGNVPIITNGQPSVQIVVGAKAAASDGVAAANLAAVLGNLAYTTQPVTVTGTSNVVATLNIPAGATNLCTLTNQQVYLNQSAVEAGGAYLFNTLIGSIFTKANQLDFNLLQYSKPPADLVNYGYNEANQLTPTPSPLTGYNGQPINGYRITPQIGGGLTVNFPFKSSTYDAFLQVSPTTSATYGLLNGVGPYQETERLWLHGFAGYNQQAKAYEAQDVFGVYEITFGKPIPISTNNAYVNYALNHGGITASQFDAANQPTFATITILGQNFTTINFTTPDTPGATTTTFVTGGSIGIASAVSPLTTVYVGQNVTAGPYTFVLRDLSYPTSEGISSAALDIYYNGVLINTTKQDPGTWKLYNYSGSPVWVYVKETFPGLYAYQKWAKIQLFSNTYTLQDGKAFPLYGNGNWTVVLRWISNSTDSNSRANKLAGILLVGNGTNATLNVGGVYNYPNGPQGPLWQAQFVGPTLTTYDTIKVTYSQQVVTFKNKGTASWVDTLHLPLNLITVSSSTPNAFIVAGYPASTFQYVLQPYELDSKVTPPGEPSVVNTANENVALIVSSVVTPTTLPALPTSLTVTVKGYDANPNRPTQVSLSFTIPTNAAFDSTGVNIAIATTDTGYALKNVTDITLSYMPSVPLKFDIVTNYAGSTTGTILATLEPYGSLVQPVILMQPSGYSYPEFFTPSVTYVPQNTQFTLSSNWKYDNIGYQGNLTIQEVGVPVATTGQYDYFVVPIRAINATAPYQLNATTDKNITYVSTQGGSGVTAGAGFISERGSQIASVGTTSVQINLAKDPIYLQFAVKPTSVAVGTKSVEYGPFSAGQLITGVPGVTGQVYVEKVTATCNVDADALKQYITVSGLDKVAPSVSQAAVVTPLNTVATPLVVLDTQANPAATLITVGGPLVNTVTQQVFAQHPELSLSPSNPVIVQAVGTNRIVVAGYTADDTKTAVNQLIQSLLAQASS
jgi:hypothetical protein